MPLVNLAFQVIPATKDVHPYTIVDEAIKVVQQSGVKYVVSPMETTMEGELDELLEIVKRAQQACIDAGAERVMTFMKMEYARSGVSMDEKLSKYR